MLRDKYSKNIQKGMEESEDHINELAGKQVKNIIKLRMLKKERAWTWNDQKAILTGFFS